MLFHSYIILFLLPSENAYQSCKINLVLDLINYCQITAFLLGQALAWLNVYGANVMQCEVLCRVLQLNPFKMWC